MTAAESRRLELNVAGGARICVPLSLDQITPYVLLEQEDWFEDEIRFVRRWLQPGMQALDIGANFGLYAVAMARAVGAGGRVWAFEPTPDTADYLQRNLELNGLAWAELHRAAVSDHDGFVEFAVGAQPELNAIAAAGAAPGELIRVHAVSLDRMAADCRWNAVDFVKMDVEGHESQAIRGGAKFFASCSPLVMLEINEIGGEKLAVLEPLADLGYQFFRLLPGPLILAPFDRLESDRRYLINLFACKSDRARELASRGFLALTDAADPPFPGKDAWAAYAGSAAYCRGLAAGWPSRAGFFAGADRNTYLQGLAAFAQYRGAGCGPEEQLALLSLAFQCVSEALDAGDTLPRRMSLARLAWELGRRGAAVDALQVAAERVAAGAQQALAEPFLAPSQRYERLATGTNPAEWLACAVVEQFEKLRYFSSVFAGTTSHLVLEPIRNLRFRSPEMDRRWELVRMKSGARGARRPAAMLCTLSEENLNPQFWSGPERALLDAGAQE